MFSERSSHSNNHLAGQPAGPRVALSPGVWAALQRVHTSLRQAFASVPCGSPPSLQVLSERLAYDGLLVTLRSGLGVGIEYPDYLSTLRHSFLICQEGCSGLCIVVDPFFREQFNVAGLPASSSYAAAVSNVPECFVGTIGTVNALVCLLTGTLLQEAAALGVELPPWRSKQALLSKWLPRRFSDSVFAPPSFASLHPALRSSVHGLLSTSPTSVQSWTSLGGTCSDLASSNGSSSNAACGSDTTTAVNRGRNHTQDLPSKRFFSEPHTIIAGFHAPPPDIAASCRDKCPAASTAVPATASALRIPSCTTRSALTQQLVSAVALSRNVQAEAEKHWESCFRSLHAQAEAQAQRQPQRQQQQAVAASDRLLTPPGSSCSLGKGLGTAAGACNRSSVSGSMVYSLVVSPVHRRTVAPGSLKRGGTGGVNSLRLSATTLKMMPRVYTVKLATAGAGCC